MKNKILKLEQTIVDLNKKITAYQEYILKIQRENKFLLEKVGLQALNTVADTMTIAQFILKFQEYYKKFYGVGYFIPNKKKAAQGMGKVVLGFSENKQSNSDISDFLEWAVTQKIKNLDPMTIEFLPFMVQRFFTLKNKPVESGPYINTTSIKHKDPYAEVENIDPEKMKKIMNLR